MSRSRRPALIHVAAATALLAAMLTATSVATAGTAAAGAPSPAPAAAPAGAAAPTTSTVAVGGLQLENSFVSAVGWVKPGETYPSRILLTNPTAATVAGASVVVTAPSGTSFTGANAPAGTTRTVSGQQVTWTVPAVAPKSTLTLVLEHQAASLATMPTVVWRELSTTATLTVSTASGEAGSHGPKVIPPSENYDTARYGDRPFPVVPVQYTDRTYQAQHSGEQLAKVINDPETPGSTFNLYQEMSLGQLFPKGTVPSAGKDGVDFAYPGGFPFTKTQPGQTCTGGTTYSDLPINPAGTALYPERITTGVYNLPGNTAYYGADANGSAVIGSLAGVGALQNIDSGCGSAGKLVYDAAAIADPEIDYSDYDTDKDGVVDFFMAVFAGCGGNGASQLSVAGCDLPNPNTGTPDGPYDNVWPHSSSLEYYYADPDTGLPGFTTDDQLKDLEGRPLWYTDETYSEKTTTDTGDDLKVFVRVGPYNVNPETAIDKASVISHEYGHSLGLPDFYSTGSRETYGDWNLMATDKSQNMDAFSRQELGWVVPQVLDESRTVPGFRDSKEDIDTITWQRPDGTSYELTEGVDGRVQNSEMYVAKLPGRQLIDPAKFEETEANEGASATHAWWSGSGNDFGCAPEGGHNLDVSIPQLADLPDGSTVKLSMKSLWDIEWDFDYGYVLTTTDGGETYTSHASDNGYTTSNTDPLAGNPNQNACQTRYDNGLTGSSGSYAADSQAADRKLGTAVDPVFLSDSFDISDLVGEQNGALRFSYATDPGLARPGWFIDDLKVTVTEPGKAAYDVLVTDLETSGGPADERFYNGGCREDLTTAQKCTVGWSYVAAGAESAQDHAYYLEMRDRSGFDLDGQGQVDRDPIGFAAGLYMAYTDEAHGYGNAGVDDPPAQTPVDSQPQPGEAAPNLDDAAFTAATGDDHYTDAKATPHVDNYTDPSTASGNWEFAFDCLSFDVLSMTGDADGPSASNGDLVGDVAFDLGPGCGDFDYGYMPDGSPAANTAPHAVAMATPSSTTVGSTVAFDATGTTDAETPDDLDYSWDFDNGGTTKDATGATASHAFTTAGAYDVTVTVTDPLGLSDKEAVRVTVTTGTTTTDPTTTPTTPGAGSGGGSSGGTGQPGVAVTSVAPATLVRALPCQGRAVGHLGSWRVLQGDAPGGSYCDNRGKRPGRDVLRVGFQGDAIDVVFGRARAGGKAVLFVDGERIGTMSFEGRRNRPRLDRHAVVSGLGTDRPHRLRLVVKRGTAYVEGFRVAR